MDPNSPCHNAGCVFCYTAELTDRTEHVKKINADVHWVQVRCARNLWQWNYLNDLNLGSQYKYEDLHVCFRSPSYRSLKSRNSLRHTLYVHAYGRLHFSSSCLEDRWLVIAAEIALRLELFFMDVLSFFEEMQNSALNMPLLRLLKFVPCCIIIGARWCIRIVGACFVLKPFKLLSLISPWECTISFLPHLMSIFPVQCLF